MPRTTIAVLLSLCTAVAVVVASAGVVAADPPDGAHVPVIVVLHDGADPRATAQEMRSRHGGEVDFVYQHALSGFAGTFPEGRIAAMRRDARVDYVQPDRPVQIQVQTVPTGIPRIFADDNAELTIDGTDDWRVDVDVAVIDTGIDFEHPDLNVNTADSVDCFYTDGSGPPWARSYSCGPGGDDDHYHGTHVAGTVGALDNDEGVVGVAPGARLWAVKVLDSSGSGYESNVVAGIDHVAANAAEIEVANMSLGGSGYSQAEYDAIQGAVEAGVAFAVAAGNSDDDARNYSPAAFDNVLTVSALADFDGQLGGEGSPTCRDDQDDTLADFSNWGPAVDLAAPGVCILSTYPLEQGGYGTISGTSMAAPHAAGALALLASSNAPTDATDVANLYDAVIVAGNLDWTDDSGDGIHEPLLDVGDATLFDPALVAGTAGDGGGGGATDAPPTVTLTSPTDGSTVAGTVSLAADASDDAGVTQVDFLVDGGVLATDTDGADGWTATWDTTAVGDGSHTVTATATDTAGQTASDSVTVTVDNTADPDISLSVTAYKVRGRQHADLAWDGATSTNVDIYRDGGLLTTTVNDGAYTDATSTTGGGSRTYQVCEAGTTTTCSNEVTVTY